MGPLQKAHHKQDDISRAIKQNHLLKKYSSLEPLTGVSLCGCVRKGVGEQECTGYNLCIYKRKQKL